MIRLPKPALIGILAVIAIIGLLMLVSYCSPDTTAQRHRVDHSSV